MSQVEFGKALLEIKELGVGAGLAEVYIGASVLVRRPDLCHWSDHKIKKNRKAEAKISLYMKR